jgi:hypothetical protein
MLYTDVLNSMFYLNIFCSNEKIVICNKQIITHKRFEDFKYILNLQTDAALLKNITKHNSKI